MTAEDARGRGRADLARSALAELRALTALAAPLVVGLAAATGITVVDTAMLGPLGSTPLAAASLTTSVLIIFYAGLYGAAGPVGLFVGRAFGGDDAAGVGRAARAGAALAAAGGAVGALVMACALPLIGRLGLPPEVTAALGPYWLWMAAGLLPYTLALAAKGVLDATGRPWTAVAFTLGPVALNAFLNWALIYGHLGFPRLGLAGAGLASFLAQCAGAAALWAHVRLAPSMRRWWASPGPLRGAIRQQAREGLPMAAQYTLEGGAVAVAGVMVGGFGATALAANQIALSVGSTIYMVPLGVAAAVTIRVAQAAGAGEPERLRAVAVAGLCVVSLWMGAFALVFLLAGRGIAALFVEDAAVIAQAGAIFVVFGLGQFFDGVQSVSLGALRGMLDNRWPTRVSIVAYWLIALPLGALLAWPGGFGAAGVWAGFSLGVAAAAAALAWRLGARLSRL